MASEPTSPPATGATTTLHQGNLAIRALLVAAAASIGIWFYLQHGEISVFVMAAGAVTLLLGADLLGTRHLLDLRIENDALILVRRRAWQPRFHGTRQTLPMDEIANVAIERTERSNTRGGGPWILYRVGLQLKTGGFLPLLVRPIRRAATAEEVAREASHVLNREVEWLDV